MLKDSSAYKDFVGSDIESGGQLVLERDLYASEGTAELTCLISVVRRGDKYAIYRTFTLDEKGFTSVDYQDISAEYVFELLFDRYSKRFA